MNNTVTPADAAEYESEFPSVNERKGSGGGMWKGMVLLMLLGVLVVGAGGTYAWYMRTKKEPKKEVATEPVANGSNSLFNQLPPPPPELDQSFADADGDLAPPAPPSAGLAPAEPAVPAPVPKPQLDRAASGLMVVEGEGKAAAAPGGPAVGAGGLLGLSPENGGLASLLNATRTESSRAVMLGDRSMIVAKGAMIDCVLRTRLDTTIPGMSSCVVTRNIYSDNGKVLLIERGSEVTGEYSQGIQMGQNRIFVLWNRLKTPHGVTIDLNSPGTDPLGAAGLGGKVNHHFWRRFGAAMLVSVVKDLATYAGNSNGSSTTTVNAGGSADTASEMANTILQSTINIPPTLYKDHGDRVSIFVARDLYFGDVYGLRAN